MSWSEIALICVSVVLIIVVLAWLISARKKLGQPIQNLNSH